MSQLIIITSRGGFGMGFLADAHPLGIVDGDFSFKVGSKNPRGFEIPGMGIGNLESPKIPSRVCGFLYRGIYIWDYSSDWGF